MKKGFSWILLVCLLFVSCLTSIALAEDASTVTTETAAVEETDATAVPVSSANRAISFDAESYVAYKGKALKISAVVENLSDDAPKTTQLVWTSSDLEIATVSTGGSVTVKSAGEVTITASAKDDESISASVKVETRNPVSSVKINEKAPTVLVGSSKEGAADVQLTVAIAPEDAYFQAGTWSSSKEDIATVDASGLVHGVSAGSAVITFTSDDPNGKKAQVTVKVNQAVEEIQLSVSSITLDAGKSASLKPTVEPKTAASKKVIWTSSDESVATVSAAGAVKAINNGTATITCTAEDGSGVYSTCSVRVITMVKSLAAKDKQTKASVFAGQETQLGVVVSPATSTNPTITWTSSDTSVAKVDTTGNVSGVSKGTCKVTATTTDGSNKKVVFNVTVEPMNPISLESLGFGIFQQNLLGITVKNLCKSKTIVNFDFDISLQSSFATESGSYSLGKDAKVGPGSKKTIKRTLFGVAYSRSITMTITGVLFSDGTYYSIPSSVQETWTFSR